MHFTRHSPYNKIDMTIIQKADGHYLTDSKGRRVIDGLSGLFTVNAGHGRQELADAAAKQKIAADAAVADVLKQQEAVAEATRQQAKIDTAVAQALSQHKSADLSLLRPSVSPNRVHVMLQV